MGLLSNTEMLERIFEVFHHSKGQLISKCPFGVFKSPKKTNEIFSRISALASKKKSNQKIKALYTTKGRILFRLSYTTFLI